MVRKMVLGTRVDLVSQDEAVQKISDWVEADGYRTRFVVTAYSEFFVNAMKDRGFGEALEASDLVTPDGVGPLAAIRYKLLIAHCSSIVCCLIAGFRVGIDVLRGEVGETVSGYWLFNRLVKMAPDRGWRIFLLGGFGETARGLAAKLQITNPKLQIMADAGAQSSEDMVGEANGKVIAKINKFKPDLLFVAYGPMRQEKWLAANKRDLKVGVAMGVGGTFDEALGLVREAPGVMTKMGLKWFWRFLQQPQRLPRIFKATVVFAWLVFVESLKEE